MCRARVAIGDEAAGERAFVSKRPEGESGSSGGAFSFDTLAGPVGRLTVAEWYVVETQRHREPVARAVLAERGIASYLPRVEQWPRPAVGAAVGPMFPGYLFVRLSFPEQAHRVLRSNGVKSFVAFGGEPVRDPSELRDLLGPESVGQQAALRIARGGQAQTLTLTVGERA